VKDYMRFEELIGGREGQISRFIGILQKDYWKPFIKESLDEPRRDFHIYIYILIPSFLTLIFGCLLRLHLSIFSSNQKVFSKFAKL